MANKEKLLSDIKQLSKHDLKLLMQEISLILSDISSSSELSSQELVPIDVPIEMSKDQVSGVLRIRIPYAIGMRNTLGWKEMEVTQAAQAILLQIFFESLEEDRTAGRIPAIKTNIQ